jgi:hypothetical protein
LGDRIKDGIKKPNMKGSYERRQVP